ncbi:CBO0543 family protein [Ornithinibacillus bavariensis]|uniref:CBO0543 family protein n=1 Tax=Ornithinibacillus bavariensis TaxID=545502 RepID=UPI000EC64C75|nr:hypothetical protein [Ornithinibacillus sp.]
MIIEWWILIVAYTLATSVLFFIPKGKYRLAIVAFLFNQAITFLVGLLVVDLGMIEYPVRLFASINRTSFTFEYYIFPIICAAFNVWYPNGSNRFIQLGYYVSYCSFMTIIEGLLERNTELIKYTHWEWYYTWITLFLSFFFVRIICVWYFSEKKLTS